jgi:hypothetical protein
VWDELARQNDIAIYEEGHLFYYQLYAGYFVKFGEFGEFFLRLFNTFLSFICIIPIQRMFKLLNGKSFYLNDLSLFLILFWPSVLRTTIDQGRTSISVLATLYAMYYVLLLFFDRITFRKLFFLFLALLLTYQLRIWYCVFPVVFFCVYFLKNWIFKTKIISMRLAWLFVLSLFCYFIFTSYFGDSFDIITFLFQQSREVMMESDQLEGGSSYLVNYFPTTMNDLFLYIPLHGLYFLFSPFLWDANTIKLLFSATFSMIFLYFFVCLLLKKRYEWSKSLVIALFTCALFLGVGVKNAGSAERWRIPITIILIAIFPTNIKPKNNET